MKPPSSWMRPWSSDAAPAPMLRACTYPTWLTVASASCRCHRNAGAAMAPSDVTVPWYMDTE